MTLHPVRWRLLENVPDDEVRELLSVARRRTFDKGEVVFHQHDPADSLHLIVSGRFAVRIQTPLGDTALINIGGPGDVFGELALVDGSDPVRSASVAALEPSETRSVYRDDFLRLRKRHPSVDALLVQLLAGQMRRANARIVDAHYVDVGVRTRRRLCELAEAYGDGGDGPVTIPLTQQDLAEIVGTARATLNRALRADERRGLIQLERGKVIVSDAAALARLAWRGGRRD
jgi:CRP-like cAMP-binding protein